MPGKLIVLEGTDGSGKSTQFALLCRRLEREGRRFHRLVFPRYQEESSALIRLYLSGAFGAQPGDVNAYAASSFYAVDRYASYRQDWGRDYEHGGLILADRYTTSNAVHQGAKVPPQEREDFFRWLYEYEYGRLGLPRPDLVCYLDMPTELALSLLRSREERTHTQADIHERDGAYLAECRRCALSAANVLGWTVISCAAGGAPRGVEEIEQDIWSAVSRALG
ncbi:MAG TPA: thymidylate kinase [Candidatus Onthomonas avicola]|nr:thymidylate kinase [Candidatus Onthomonas avicola]